MTGQNADRAYSLINSRTEAELIELNKIVVRKLNAMHRLKSRDLALKWNVGMKVSFSGPRGTTITGTIVKTNPTSASIQPDTIGGFRDYRRWRVGYSLLSPA